MVQDAKLPVHGFVLAGGKSSRMGEDKALLRFCGRPMVEIAVEKLRGFCAEVTIAGNREDLREFAPVVRETRTGVGPAAGIEAGLGAASEEWALFVPVDVPLVPGELLRRWCEEALRVGMSVSLLGAGGRKQPAFCLLQRERVGAFTDLLDGGERRLEVLLNRSAESDGFASWTYDEHVLYGRVEEGAPDAETVERWFKNVNTPEDLAEAEAWAGADRVGGR
ncbi:MAG TPA: molybdenum cofactor guanylyltransferase [Acidobacteriaceae bacterium]|nr:molybdenum cofactor guanylyltransferase [Acidobacteriaceae bacterium]